MIHSQNCTSRRLALSLATFTFVLLAGCEAVPVSIRISFASPTATATQIPTPTSTPSPVPTPTVAPTAAVSCGANIEVVDSSIGADFIWERIIPYLQELETCGARARIEILDGEDVGIEITGGGEPAGAYTWCYPRGDIGERTETIIAVGLPEWDQWNTYLQGWTVVGEGLYPSSVLLHELYHVRQCLVTGEVVEVWDLDDEYPADSYALESLKEIRAAPIIVFGD
ncbi:MAG: hypothetical protein HYX86_05640 [Chloroflexi bacterium]|nr:hypothetical protein [Chloroflexota bacterium]